jgi:hypothetical protein
MGILRILRKEPHYLVDALARGGWISTDRFTKYHDKLSRILITSLFRNAFSPTDEKLLIRFLMVRIAEVYFFNFIDFILGSLQNSILVQ